MALFLEYVLHQPFSENSVLYFNIKTTISSSQEVEEVFRLAKPQYKKTQLKCSKMYLSFCYASLIHASPQFHLKSV